MDLIKPLIVKTQAQVAKEFLNNIEGKAKGEIPSFKTEYEKLNELFGGSLETNSIITIAGGSGGGKSTISELISYSIHKETSNENWEVIGLNINLEMLSLKTFGRIVAKESKLDSSTIYSLKKSLSATDYNKIKNDIIPYLSQYKIYYVEESGDPKELLHLIYEFWKKYVKTPPNSIKKRLMIVQLDHSLLVEGDNDQDKLKELMVGLKSLKKRIANEGGHALYMVLSQLNRNIEARDRITNPALHAPGKGDIYGSDACYMNSDYVIIAHNPRRLQLPFYKQDMYPVKATLDDTKEEVDFIYFECIKNREAKDGTTTSMIAYFKFFALIEIQKEEMKEFLQKIKEGKPIIISRQTLESRIKSLKRTNNNDDCHLG